MPGTIRIRAPLRHAVASAEVRFTKRCTCDCTEIPKTRQIGKSSGAMLTGVTCFGFCYELQNFRMGVAVWERNFRSKSLFCGWSILWSHRMMGKTHSSLREAVSLGEVCRHTVLWRFQWIDLIIFLLFFHRQGLFMISLREMTLMYFWTGTIGMPFVSGDLCHAVPKIFSQPLKLQRSCFTPNSRNLLGSVRAWFLEENPWQYKAALSTAHSFANICFVWVCNSLVIVLMTHGCSVLETAIW